MFDVLNIIDISDGPVVARCGDASLVAVKADAHSADESHETRVASMLALFTCFVY